MFCSPFSFPYNLPCSCNKLKTFSEKCNHMDWIFGYLWFTFFSLDTVYTSSSCFASFTFVFYWCDRSISASYTAPSSHAFSCRLNRMRIHPTIKGLWTWFYGLGEKDASSPSFSHSSADANLLKMLAVFRWNVSFLHFFPTHAGYPFN